MMGQYFLVANMNKKQFIDPGNFKRIADKGPGCSMKLHHLCKSVLGGALVFLLSTSDYCPFMGSWAGDRIVVVGDEDPGVFLYVYEEIREEATKWQEISRDVAEGFYDFLKQSGMVGPATDLALDEWRGDNFTV